MSLNLKDGKERWHKPICDLDQYYFGSMAPLVVKNHIITGVSGDDLDRPGYIESHDPETGDLQWRWYTVPQKMGDPGSETWPSEEAMKHGGGMTWLTPTYDPELNMIYVPTGNPQPVIAGKARPGANLFTASVVALNPDTGKMQWYFQSSPHDTHDWDATQTPVLFDGEINGQKRKLVAQASRNGYFFVLDRATGKNIVEHSEYVKVNWSKGVDAKGSPIPNPAKEPQLDGALVSPNQGGATNWPPPTYDPDTGLFYVSASRAFSVYYIYDPSDKPEGWGGNDRGGWGESMIQAHRLQDRQGQMEPQVGRWRPFGLALHGRQTALRRRRVRQPGRARPGRTATRCGTRIWAAPSPTARSLTNSMARSTWWSRRATLCSASRCCGSRRSMWNGRGALGPMLHQVTNHLTAYHLSRIERREIGRVGARHQPFQTLGGSRARSFAVVVTHRAQHQHPFEIDAAGVT